MSKIQPNARRARRQADLRARMIRSTERFLESQLASRRLRPFTGAAQQRQARPWLAV